MEVSRPCFGRVVVHPPSYLTKVPTSPTSRGLARCWQVMGMRVCNVPGCGEVQAESRCAEHRRTREQRRGTRQERGYDRAYELDRMSAAPKVAAGKAVCWSCGQRISPLAPWHHGHCEDDRGVIHGPEHPLCNERHKGQACPHPSHSDVTPTHPWGVTPLGLPQRTVGKGSRKSGGFRTSAPARKAW